MSAASLAGSAATGSGASGTWNIAISGNAATSTTVTTTVASGATGTTQAVTTNDTTIATTAFVRSIIPAGVILMWSGSIASIPSGWVLCNGANGTPNLQDRFIVGAGSTYAVAATGGSANAVVVSHSHTTTVTDAGHQHASSTGQGFLTRNTASGNALNGGSDWVFSNINNTATSTTGITVSANTTGSSGTNANLPPYYALCYIMKA
jgi:hypothetical protein